jgi:hypothetical protein
VEETPQRAKLIDVFMGFLLVVGGLQFLYCVLAGNYVSSSFVWQVLLFWSGLGGDGKECVREVVLPLGQEMDGSLSGRN